jgi:hypothetical protein
MKSIRLHLGIFMLLLILSGLSAFPVQTEIDFLFEHLSSLALFAHTWIESLHGNLHKTPMALFYGTDWLAFAHIIIALFFVPVFLDPQKYRINLYIGMAACCLVFPLAFICGPLRQIPFFHQLIDCSFSLIGFTYLSFILHRVNKLQAYSDHFQTNHKVIQGPANS